MISLLRNIVEGILDFAAFVASGVIEVWNLIMTGIEVAANSALGIGIPIPHVADIPTEVAEYANWFFPFGTIASFLVSCLVMYVAWLGIRYLLRLARAA